MSSQNYKWKVHLHRTDLIGYMLDERLATKYDFEMDRQKKSLIFISISRLNMLKAKSKETWRFE